MQDEHEKKITRFNSDASVIYSSVYKEFNESIYKINRHRDENVFKMQAAKYGYALKTKLDMLVKNILDASGKDTNVALHRALSTRVSFYLDQFRQKWNAL
jgi:hypothetical protein